MNKISIRKLNKWQIVFGFIDDFECYPKRKKFIFGIFNIHTFPKEGDYLSKENYKGFLIQWIIPTYK